MSYTGTTFTLVSALALFAGVIGIPVNGNIPAPANPNTTLSPQIELYASSSAVHIQVFVDTKKLMADFPAPSKDYEKPELIQSEKYIYMVAPPGFVESGQASTKLKLQNSLGKMINWSGLSESNNYIEKVIVYDVKHTSSNLAKPFVQPHSLLCAQPKEDKIASIDLVPCTTLFVTASVSDKGTMEYTVLFALFSRNEDKEQKLHGYFEKKLDLVLG